MRATPRAPGRGASRFSGSFCRCTGIVQPRRGSVLLLVLVVIPLLSLGAYVFADWMRAESQASVTAVQQAQARWAAESGIEMVRAILADPASNDPTQVNLDDDAALFAAQPIIENPDGSKTLVAVVAPIGDGSTLRYGLTHESAKIPLHNRGLDWTRESLLGLPGMSEDIADAILDWIDEDQEQRELGAESDYYLGLNPAYEARNKPLRTLDELLLVKGVTAQLLYGEDYNLDGLLNPNEDDGDENWPPDDADGVLNRGWYSHLTLSSACVNLDAAGVPRVNINEQQEGGSAGASSSAGGSAGSAGSGSSGSSGSSRDSGTSNRSSSGSGNSSSQGESTSNDPFLDKMIEVFGEADGAYMADFARKLRQQNGGELKAITDLVDAVVQPQPQQGGDNNAGSGTNAGGRRRDGGGDQRDGGQGQGGNGRGADQQGGGGDRPRNPQRQVQPGGPGGPGAPGGPPGTPGTVVPGQGPGGNPQDQPQQQPMFSRWTSSNLADYLPAALDAFTTAKTPVSTGLVDVLRAPAAVLQSLPGITPDLAEAIADSASQRDPTDTTAAWLLTENILTLEQFRKIEPFITTTGRVFRVESVGFGSTGPAIRVEAIIDASESVPKVVYKRELRRLGSAYTREMLGFAEEQK